MTTTIIDTIVERFPDYMNEGIITGEPDYLETIERGPLQDDPTKRASYLIVEPDLEADPDGYRQPVGSARKNKLKVVETAPEHEIGGGFRMITYFRIGGWTPRARTKTDGYAQIGRYTRRVERAVQQMARNVFPAGIETDDGQESTGDALQVFNLRGTVARLKGGENEWYGLVYVNFGVYSTVQNDYWR